MQASKEEFAKKLKLGRNLTDKDVVCEVHFYPSDIVRFHPDLVINGEVIKGSPRKTPALREGAIPHIFPGCPKHMTTPEKRSRPAPKPRISSPQPKTKRRRVQLFKDGQVNLVQLYILK